MTRTRFFRRGAGRRPAARQAVRRGRSLIFEPLEVRTLLAAAGLTDSDSLKIDPSMYEPSRILVRFRPEAAAAREHAAVAGTSLGREFHVVPGLREVRLPPGLKVEEALAAYRANPQVLYAEPDYRVQIADTVPNDPDFPLLWGLNNTGQTRGTAGADIDAPLAWDNFAGNGDAIVAVIDTGVDYTHPDLAPNMWVNSEEWAGSPGVDDDGNGYVDDIHGYDFANNDGDPFDDNFHGTHVAGTIGGAGDNNVGVAGVNWNARIMAVKFLDASGWGWMIDAILALDYAVANGAVISNNSWEGGAYSQGLYDAIASAGQSGHLFVAAAGNEGANLDRSPIYPAAYDLDNIISVAATDASDRLADFSNYGRKSVDVGAPGVSIYSTLPGGGYGYLSGTSMASPHVAGVASLVRELHPEWGYAQVKSAILDSVDRVHGLRNTVSGGRLNAAAAAVGAPPPDTRGPRVAIHSPDLVVAPFSSVRVTFNEAIGPDPGGEALSFTAADVSVTGPAGDIAISSVTPVAGSNDRQFDITFAEQSEEGTYTIVIGPDIYDTAGNGMDQDGDGLQREASDDQYTGQVNLDYCVGPDGFGYEACVYPFEDIDLVAGEPGVFTLLDGADDGFASVDLGANTFTFYGSTYPYEGTIWLSSNGLITFGSQFNDLEYLNADLSDYPPQRAIAPLWDDWRTDLDGADQVLGKFDDTDSDGTADRLILEWSQVRHHAASPSDVTFQAILGLNGGAGGGDIIFNYPDLDTGDRTAEGRSATVGVKDSGVQGPNRLLVSYNRASPYVGTGKALRIPGSAPAALYIDDVSVPEGDSGTVDAVFTVSLANPPADQTVTVQYHTSDYWATAPEDYEATSGTLTFAPGTTTQTVTVRVNGDTEVEGDEAFWVELSDAVNAEIHDLWAWGRIIDDDDAGITLSPTSGLVTTEDGGTDTFTVVLDAQPTADVEIFVSSSNIGEGTVAPGLLTFTSLDWNTPQTVTVTGVDDGLVDGDVAYTIYTLHARSDDPSYDGLDPPDVSVTNLDNEGPTGENYMYVWDIGFESKTRGKGGAIHDERIIVTVLRDSDADGVAEATDLPVGKATVRIRLTGPPGGGFAGDETYIGTTDMSGVLQTAWVADLADGTYTAEVTQVVPPSGTTYQWDPFETLDPTVNDTDYDGDGWPEQQHDILAQATRGLLLAAFSANADRSSSHSASDGPSNTLSPKVRLFDSSGVLPAASALVDAALPEFVAEAERGGSGLSLISPTFAEDREVLLGPERPAPQTKPTLRRPASSSSALSPDAGDYAMAHFDAGLLDEPLLDDLALELLGLAS